MKNYMNEEYIIYLRKSRADSEYETLEEVLIKHETQLQDFSEKELGYRISEENIYREVVSGETIEDRPMFQEVLKRIELCNVKGVMVVDPQRLSRGDLEDCGRIVNAFRYSNTLIITPIMTYNLSDKMQRKFFEQELMRGNDYLEYQKEILLRGRIASVKKGNFIGSIAPYGYKKIKYKEGNIEYCTLEIIPEEADAIRLMYDLFINKNYGFTRIAYTFDDMGIKPKLAQRWSPAAIKDMLENPVYIGKIRWNWRKTVKNIENGEIKKSRPKSGENDWLLVEGHHEAIISDELYQSALDKRGKNIRVKSKVKVRNPFAGIVFCKCGRAMSYRTYNDSKGNERTKPRLLCDDQVHCKNKSCTYSDFEQYVIDVLKNVIEDFEIKLANDDGNSSKIHLNMIKNLENELAHLNELDDEQHDLLESKIYTRETFLKRNAKLQEKKQKVIKSLNTAKETIPTTTDYKEKILRFSEALESLQNTQIDAQTKNALLKKCIKKIEYSRITNNRTKYDNTPFTIEIQLLV